jgi:aspartyl protease family protein
VIWLVAALVAASGGAGLGEAVAQGQATPPAPPPAAAPAEGQARAAQIQLGGVMGNKALLVIDGQPQMLGVGEAARGVRLLALTGEQARVEHQGRTFELRVGGSPLVLGGTGGRGAGTSAAREIVIPVGTGGHYLVNGSINGHAVRFMVDTGATTIAMGRADAARIGLDPRKGQLGYASTANGTAPMLAISLDRVRVGDVELYNIAAAVTATDMPYVLLGNSFLDRFQIQRDSDVLRLVRRY